MDLVIVEDSELVQAQLLRLVSLRGGIDVVGIAASEDAAVSLIASSHPDAVLLDLALAPGSGIRVLERIRNAGCAARVLVLTNTTADVLRQACEALGISGFYDKSRDVPACMDQLFGWLAPSPLDGAPQSASFGKPAPDSDRPTGSFPLPSGGRLHGAIP